jgi:site-specific DNA recombinase
LKRAGVDIDYALGDYPDTPEGRLNKHIRATIAEYEREKIKERNTRGRRNVVKQGRIMLHGDRPPFGYRVSQEGAKLVIHEPEAAIVQQIFAWYTKGNEQGDCLSAFKIAKRLSEMEAPTWSDIHGVVQKQRGYGQWSSTIVLDILHSETYKGKWHYGRRNAAGRRRNPREHWVTLEVPSIVSDTVWEEAQRQCRQNTALADRNIRREYLLRHRLTCQCGYSVQGYCVTTKRKNGVKVPYLYYRCSGVALDVAKKGCHLPSFRVDHVDAAVWEWVKSLLADPTGLLSGLNDYREGRDRENAPVRDRLRVVQDLITDNRQQLERLLDLYLAGSFPKEMLADRQARLESTIASLEKVKAGLLAHLELRTLTGEQIETLCGFAMEVAQGFAAADEDFQTRRRVIETLDVRAILAVEDAQKIVYITCILGDISLPVSGCATHYSKCGVSHLSSTE